MEKGFEQVHVISLFCELLYSYLSHHTSFHSNLNLMLMLVTPRNNNALIEKAFSQVLKSTVTEYWKIVTLLNAVYVLKVMLVSGI